MVVLIVVSIVVVVAIIGATYTFYSQGKTSFEFVVGSKSGAEIGLSVKTSNGGLVPAETSGSGLDYSASANDSQESYAGFVVECNCMTSSITLDITIGDVSYKKNGVALDSNLTDYLDGAIEYTVIYENFVTTVVNNEDVYSDGKSTLYTTSQVKAMSLSWNDASSGTTSAWRINNILATSTHAKSYAHVYVRFKSAYTQELIPEALFDNVEISFTLFSEKV